MLNLKIIKLIQGLFRTGDLVGISIITWYSKCLSLKKVRMISVLKFILQLNQQYIKNNLINLQKTFWDKVTEEQIFMGMNLKLMLNRMVLLNLDNLFLLYFDVNCWDAVLKKIKCNSIKNVKSERDNVEEIVEIKSYFPGSTEVLYLDDTIINFVLYNYVVIGKLIKDYSFLHSVNQRKFVRQWPGRPGFSPRSSHTKTQKMVLDASLLNTQHYKVRIKGKVEQSREWVAPSPTPWCSSYRKGSLWVTLDFGRHLYFTYDCFGG